MTQHQRKLLVLNLAAFAVGFSCGLVPLGLLAWLGVPINRFTWFVPLYMGAALMLWAGRGLP